MITILPFYQTEIMIKKYEDAEIKINDSLAKIDLFLAQETNRVLDDNVQQ